MNNTFWVGIQPAIGEVELSFIAETIVGMEKPTVSKPKINTVSASMTLTPELVGGLVWIGVKDQTLVAWGNAQNVCAARDVEWNTRSHDNLVFFSRQTFRACSTSSTDNSTLKAVHLSC